MEEGEKEEKVMVIMVMARLRETDAHPLKRRESRSKQLQKTGYASVINPSVPVFG